ncbi:hypothetical protein PUN28_011638 [Cardiocondyla obscurior]|uniref:Uncharacterized protein n=1 Tax=Cardiocondyla obscurior TaxID=286306 RepID=A0AAW2FEW9_9HYME
MHLAERESALVKAHRDGRVSVYYCFVSRNLICLGVCINRSSCMYVLARIRNVLAVRYKSQSRVVARMGRRTVRRSAVSWRLRTVS